MLLIITLGHFPERMEKLACHMPDPRLKDQSHDHKSWLNRSTKAVKGQYLQKDIPHYFSYAKNFTLCDNYFTDIVGPSIPNHFILIAADSPIINNPHKSDPANLQPPYDIPSLPKNL